MRPGWMHSWKPARAASIRSATAGAMRCRCTSHQGRKWRRKRALLGLWHGLPDFLGEGPQPIHHGLPAPSLGHRLVRIRAQQSGEGRDARGQRPARRRGGRHRPREMPARHQAATGNRVDGAGMALVDQGNHRVHHGQAGADNQHGGGRIEIGIAIRRPGIGAIERAVIEAHIRDGHWLGREIAHRQHHDIGLQNPVSAEIQNRARAGLVDRLDVAVDQLEAIAEIVALQLLIQQMADIGAEQASWHEAAFGGLHALQRLVWLGLEPVQEIMGPVAKGAHPSGRDVQQMAGIGGGIGLPPAELQIPLDQRDAHRRGTAAQ